MFAKNIDSNASSIMRIDESMCILILKISAQLNLRNVNKVVLTERLEREREGEIR